MITIAPALPRPPSHGVPRSKVLVRIDPASKAARLEVGALVTQAGYWGPYVVCRRVVFKLPDSQMPFTDIAPHAQVAATPLWTSSGSRPRQAIVSSGIDSSRDSLSATYRGSPARHSQDQGARLKAFKPPRVHGDRRPRRALVTPS